VNIIAIDKIIVRISQKSAHGAESFMAINWYLFHNSYNALSFLTKASVVSNIPVAMRNFQRVETTENIIIG
jgi:hypothetical protein